MYIFLNMLSNVRTFDSFKATMHYAAFHLCLHCLQRVYGFPEYKGLKTGNGYSVQMFLAGILVQQDLLSASHPTKRPTTKLRDMIE